MRCPAGSLPSPSELTLGARDRDTDGDMRAGGAPAVTRTPAVPASALSKALVENTLGEEVRHVLAGPDVLEVVLVEEAVVLED